MKTKMVIIVILAALIMAVITYQNLRPDTYVYQECSVDSDCVPDECCHAKACTAKENAPDCKGAICTLNCEPGTLDCYGSCTCVKGVCTAVIEDN